MSDCSRPFCKLMKPIKGYEKYYCCPHGFVFSKRTKRSVLKNNLRPQGYRAVFLQLKNGGRKRVMVHRLVAQCFINNYSEDLEVNHIDGDVSNNSVENLEMLTKQENTRHKWEYLWPSSGYVKIDNGKYVARFSPFTEFGQVTVGRYDCPKEAQFMYSKAYFEWFGSYPYLKQIKKEELEEVYRGYGERREV